MSRRSFYTGFMLLILPMSGYAQSNYAMLRGSITDSQHRAIPFAHVRITASATGTTRELATDGAGR
jgi:hypothetical protein